MNQPDQSPVVTPGYRRWRFGLKISGYQFVSVELFIPRAPKVLLGVRIFRRFFRSFSSAVRESIRFLVQIAVRLRKAIYWHFIPLVRSTIYQLDVHQRVRYLLIKLRLINPIYPDLHRQPLVSILLVTYNSAPHLERLLECVARQNYNKYELICVDNASNDCSVDIFRSWQAGNPLISATLLPQLENLGFAQAVNLAYQHACGEYIALLNADAFPEQDWLFELVTALRLFPHYAAVSPRIRFDSLFVNISLKFSEPTSLDLKTLIEVLPYPKIFVHEGELLPPDELRTSARGCLVMDVPANIAELHIRLHSEQSVAPVSDNSTPELLSVFPHIRGFNHQDMHCRSDATLVINCESLRAAPFWIINNAGSTTNIWVDQPCDVGFGCSDLPRKDELEASDRRRFCGCSVLIRRSALLDRDLFVPEFFAYYEDSELSRWLLLNRRGPILYWPRSILRHYHSSSLGEQSPSWWYLTCRAYLLYRLMGCHPSALPARVAVSLQSELHHIAVLAERKGVAASLREAIAYQDSALLAKAHTGDSLIPYRRSIAVYNLFWNTCGGGEVHALYLARRLKDQYPDCHVYLLSESDFDLDGLASYFNVDPAGLLKLVVDRVTPVLTQRFWLFVNSTSHSSLVSRAVNSWYIVSFPHRTALHQWQQSYTFLANSKFTQHWMQRWWRCTGTRCAVLYPVAHLAALHERLPSVASSPLPSTRRILAVGRFTRRGHAKNQHLILEAFLRLIDSPAFHWGLTLVGSLDVINPDDCAYYCGMTQRVAAAAAEGRVSIETNVSHQRLSWLLHHADCFVHAAGLGMSPIQQPDLHEHFGIAPVEAALAGCVPIVYAIGGPAEVLEQTKVGMLFNSFDQLVDRLSEFTSLSETELEQRRLQARIGTRSWLDAVASAPLPALRER